MKKSLNCLFLFFIAFFWLQAALGNPRHRHYSDSELRHYKRLVSAHIRDYLPKKDPYYNSNDDEDDNQPQINDKDLPKNGELFEGDMVMDSSIRRAVLGLNKKRGAVRLAEEGNRRHWKNGVVPYTLDSSLNAEVRQQIIKAVQEFKLYTCIKYVPRTDEEDYVTFKDGKGCSSSVGRQGGQQFIHLAFGCKRIGTVMHEMMHAIGIIHEQSRSDRDEYVEVRMDHIKEKLLPNFRKYSLDESDNMDIPYNFFSVMHYSNYAFSNDHMKTIVSRSDPDLHFGQRVQLTPLDIKQINRLYPCHKSIDARDLIPNMTERDVRMRKRDEMKDLYEDLF